MYFYAARYNKPAGIHWALGDKDAALAYAQSLYGRAEFVWSIEPKNGARSLDLRDLKNREVQAIFDQLNRRRAADGEAVIPENRWPRTVTLDLLEREAWILPILKRKCDYAVLTDYAYRNHDALVVLQPSRMVITPVSKTAEMQLVRKLVEAAHMLLIGKTVTMGWDDFGSHDLLDTPIDAKVVIDAPDRPSQGGMPAIAIEIDKNDLHLLDDDEAMEDDLLEAAKDELGFSVIWIDTDWTAAGQTFLRSVKPSDKETTFRYRL